MRITFRTLFKTPSGLEYLYLSKGPNDMLCVQGSQALEGRIRRVYSCGLRLYEAAQDVSLQPVSCVSTKYGFNAVFEGSLGGPLREFLKHAPAVVQYAQGKRIGRILKAFHSLPLSKLQEEKAHKRQSSFLERLAQYISSMPHFKGDSQAIDVISKRFGNYDCYRMCMRYGQLRHDRIFVRPDFGAVLLPSSTSAPGDICEDFALMECMSAGMYPLCCAGIIDGYFQGNVPKDFFAGMALHSALYSLWKCGKLASVSSKAYQLMQGEFDRIVADFRGFKEYVPLWYSAYETKKVKDDAIRNGF